MSVTSATLSGVAWRFAGLAEPIEATVSADDRDERERRDDHPFANRHIPSLVAL